MKLTKSILIITLMVFSLLSVSAQQNEVPSDVVSAFSNGDASKLSAFLNSNVEIVIGKTNDVFSKQQATGIIADFFKKNKVTDFSILHNGKRESAGFVIGTLTTVNGIFRVYILLRKNGNQTFIQQLRIESSNE